MPILNDSFSESFIYAQRGPLVSKMPAYACQGRLVVLQNGRKYLRQILLGTQNSVKSSAEMGNSFITNFSGG